MWGRASSNVIQGFYVRGNINRSGLCTRVFYLSRSLVSASVSIEWLASFNFDLS